MGFSGSSSFCEGFKVKQELCDDDEVVMVPQPLERLQGSPVPPFLSKTYDLVEDPSLDEIISWGAKGESFVVWDPVDFSRTVLPRNFKHNNFSSFVRQLNTYRFRKIDCDKWEFANEGFVRGKRHLLKNIQRRKSPHSLQGSYLGATSESVRPGCEDELEMLCEEKQTLMREVAELQIEQDGTAHVVELVNQRIQVAEQRQKLMVTFLYKLFHNPALIARLQEKKKRKEMESLKMKRKFVTLQPHVASGLNLNIDKEVRYSPHQRNLYGTSVMIDSISVSIPQVPDHVSGDLVGKFSADDEKNPINAQDVIVTELPTSKEMAVLEGFITTPGDMSEAVMSLKNRSSVFKGENKLATLDDFSPEYLVSFPEKNSHHHRAATSGTACIGQSEDTCATGFDTDMVMSIPSVDLWDNAGDYITPELGSVSSTFSDVWDFGSPQLAPGSSAMEKWTDDEITFDELDLQLVLDHPGDGGVQENMDR